MNKKILASLVALLSIALIPALVSAYAFTVTLVSPANNSVISGSSVVLNATVTGNNVKKCDFYARSLSTANSSWVEIASVTNDTVNDTVFNTTFDSTVLEDSNDYQFYANCQNDTNYAKSEKNTVTVDNTVPDTPTSLSPSDKTVDTDGTVTFSATVTDSKTTGCTLHLGVNSYTMTYSGSSCTYTVSNLPEREYRWYITASDGTNSTNSATYTLIVDIQKAAGKKYLIEQYLKEKQKKPFTFTIGGGGGEKSLTEVIAENKEKVFWGIIIVLIVVAVIYFGKSGSQRKIVYYRG